MLAGRYRLDDRVRTRPDGSLWRAVDETLERPVLVSAYAVGHPYGGEIVDAARRAALVEDPRLQRVLAAGTERGTPYVVLEPAPGRTLTELLQNGPFAAETGRRLAGEAAEALDRAAARGLHHLRLRPTSLIVARNGTVTVAGTAIDAAADGIEAPTSAAAARSDAAGLVALLYAALTGRWPGTQEAGLARAPRVAGRPVPPGDLVAGVPNDLDTLCSVMLGPHDDGPRSPGELARQLAPWAPAAPLTDPRGLHIGAPGRPVASMPAARAARSRSQSAPGTAAAPAAGTDPLTPAAAAADPTPVGTTPAAPATARADRGPDEPPPNDRAPDEQAATGATGAAATATGELRRLLRGVLGPATASGGIPLAATAPPPGAPLADAPAPLGAPVPAAAPPDTHPPVAAAPGSGGTSGSIHRSSTEGGSAPEGGARGSAGRARARDAPHISVRGVDGGVRGVRGVRGARTRGCPRHGRDHHDRSVPSRRVARNGPSAGRPPRRQHRRSGSPPPSRRATGRTSRGTSPRAPWTPSRSSDRSRTPRSRSRRSPPGPRWPGRPGSSPGSCCSCSPFSSSSSGCSP